MKKNCLYLFIIVNALKLVAQSSVGVHPSSIQWKNIDTETVKVIFSEGQEKEANRIANVIDLINENYSQSVGNNSKKIDLILQTNQVISNGFVGLAPFRSEFFATPFQNTTLLGTTNWLDALSIHEYRHVQQFVNGKQGFTKFMSYLQGQQGWGFALNLSLPNWYFEGDATIAETVFTKNGRGRTPRFYSEQRALLLNNINYSYLKARNRSFKDIVPDQYPLGFTIINYIRNKYHPNIWSNILADAGSYRSIIYPFSGALKKHTGFRAPALYKKSYNQLKENWLAELDTIQLTPTTPVTKRPKHTVTNYRNAHYLNDGSIVAVKSSFKRTPHLIHIKNNKESILTEIGIEPEGFISENNNKIAWTEFKTDIRWANRNYTIVKTFDVNTKKKATITKKGKYFSPHISTNGNQIVVVETNENLENSILILDNNGNIISKLSLPYDSYPSFPKWTYDDRSIVYLLKKDSEIAFFSYELASKKTTQLTNWTINTIGNYNLDSTAIYFNAGHSGIDNIYKVTLNGNKKIEQLSSVVVGAYTPDVSPSGNQIIMSELTSKGNQLTTLKLSEALNKTIVPTPATEMKRFQINLSDNENVILDSIPNNSHTIEDYNGFFKGTKLHSWSLNTNTSATSATIQFDNILSDFSANVNATYNFNENVTSLGGSIFFGKYFPVFSLSVASQSRSTEQQLLINNGEEINVGIGINRFDEQIASLGITTPLNWIRGNYRTSLIPSIAYQHRFISDSNLTSNFNFGTISNRIFLSNSRRTALQNLAPRWSQTLDITFLKSITNNNAENFRAIASFNFPGILRNHSLNIEGEFQNENLSNPYQFIDRFQYARGFSSLISDQAIRFSANYRLPLFYPDWGFGGITYFKRINANLFYDYSEATINFNNSSVAASSTGIEILFNNTFFNVLPLTFGVRSSYKIDNPFNQDRLENQLFFGTTF